MRFIPAFHFQPAEDKLKKEFCDEVISYYYYSTDLRSLLHNKNVDEIEGYADGTFDLEPFKKMFSKGRKDALIKKNNATARPADDKSSKSALHWERVAAITPKLNAAIALLQKVPLEITATCLDSLAQTHKQKDLDFLKNKANMEAELQPLHDSMNLGKVDMGATQYSSVPFTAMPLDLDVNDPQEFELFSQIIYRLAPESSFETVLQSYADFKKVHQVRLQETRDQYKYGISAHRVYGDKTTVLPTHEYLFPGSVRTDPSKLPDYSDNVVRFIEMHVTPEELFKYFPDEIADQKKLEKIVNGSGEEGEKNDGYCACNQKYGDVGGKGVPTTNFGTYRMILHYVEVKSIDKVMIGQKKNSKYKYITNDETKKTEEVWGQNTYYFYWLQNTKWFFGIDRLGFAHRSVGCESYTNFSSNIYKTQPKGPVELCIGENKKMQMAEIKLQHTIIMSAPPGKVVDMKYIREALKGLKEENSEYTIGAILEMAKEDNIFIVDSQGYEGKQSQGQFVPVKDLPGGLPDSILGYYRVTLEGDARINRYLGTNDQLLGQSTTPEGLVGLQKLLINSSVNSLYLISEGVRDNYQAFFNTVAWYVQESIKAGGRAKEAIVNLIGTRKTEIIAGLKNVPIHQIGIKITLGQREEERAMNRQRVQVLKEKGILNSFDEYVISNTANPKDAAWIIAVKEHKWQKKQEEQQDKQLEAQQQAIETQSQAMLQKGEQEQAGKTNAIQVQGEVDAKLMQLGHQLGMDDKKIESLIKLKMDSSRIQEQAEKDLRKIQASKAYEAQQPLI